VGEGGVIAIDLFCGLGGWAEGFLAEGYDVIGFDIERHVYPRLVQSVSDSVKLPGNATADRWCDRPVQRLRDAVKGAVTDGYQSYPGQLVLQDVSTLDGAQFREAQCIVASPPCQAYSYRAMPWKRAKALPPPDNTLFEACFRIQREACAAGGRYIPMVVENVCGAQRWVGRAAWHYGSYYLWGDVPALMPFAWMMNSAKNGGGYVGYERNHPAAFGWKIPAESPGRAARKAASAEIAKIPYDLARWVAMVFKTESKDVAA
jgi:hypothetical protein